MTAPADLRKLDAQVAALMGDVCVKEGEMPYSTDASAMLLLLAHLRAQGWTITLDMPARKGRSVSCTIFRGSYAAAERHYAAAPALPEAVAKAAAMTVREAK